MMSIGVGEKGNWGSRSIERVLKSWPVLLLSLCWCSSRLQPWWFRHLDLDQLVLSFLFLFFMSSLFLVSFVDGYLQQVLGEQTIVLLWWCEWRIKFGRIDGLVGPPFAIAYRRLCFVEWWVAMFGTWVIKILEISGVVFGNINFLTI